MTKIKVAEKGTNVCPGLVVMGGHLYSRDPEFISYEIYI